MCSYFTHFADNPAQEAAARARQIRYYKECVIPALPGDPKNAPPSYTYFIDMVAKLKNARPEDLTDNAVCSGRRPGSPRPSRRFRRRASTRSFSTSMSASSRTSR